MEEIENKKVQEGSTPLTPDGEVYSNGNKDSVVIDTNDLKQPKSTLPKRNVPKGAVTLMLTKVKDKRKFKIATGVAIMLLLIICSCILTSSLLSGTEESEEPIAQPSVTPKAEPTVFEASPSPTPIVTTEPMGVSEWPTFVLSSCNLRLKVPEDWVPNRVGELGSCGMYRSTDAVFSNFDDFPGIVLVVMPMASESIFWDANRGDAASYISTLDKRATSSTTKDRFVESGEVVFISQVVQKVVIDRRLTGQSTNLFYESFGKDYVIIWGGQEVESDSEVIDDIIGTMEFLQPT